MRVWVSRAEPGAAATAGRLRKLGHEPLVAPVLEIRALPCAIGLDGVGAIAFTSLNGVGAFPATEAAKALPVFVVGDTTAEAARAAGFGEVRSAAGDGAALAALIATVRAPDQGAVLVARAREAAFDLEGALAAAGIVARTAIVYESAPASPQAGVREALKAEPPLEAVLVHSRRGAMQVARMLAGAPARERLSAFCISEAAAEPLRGIGLKSVATAAFPNEPSLLKLLGEPSEAS
jgi:uroporphyrinogen-III synthase